MFITPPDAMSEFDELSKLDLAVPSAPASSPPTVSELAERLNHRKRRRKGAAAVAVATVGLLASFLLRPDSSESESHRDFVVESVRETVGSTSDGELKLEDDAGIRLFATVRQSLPVFEVEKDTQLVHHVGWVDSESVIPIDLESVADDRREFLRAVLNDEPLATRIHL